jgi:PAS domain S-box-containing protein
MFVLPYTKMWNISNPFKLKKNISIQEFTLPVVKSLEKKTKLALEKSQNYLLLEEIPHPSYLWRKENNNLILIAINQKALKNDKRGLKSCIGSKASDYYNQKSQRVKYMNECLKSKSKMVKDFGNLTLKLISIDSNTLLIIEKEKLENNVKKALRKKKNDLNAKLRELEEKVEKLKKSKKKYKKIFENCPDFIFINNEGGEIVDANPRAAKYLGVSLESLIGKNLGDFFRRKNSKNIPTAKELIKGKRLLEGYHVEGKNMRGEKFVSVIYLAIFSIFGFSDST